MNPAVTLALVTYNSARLLADFAASLPDALDGVESWALVVADNASGDDSVLVAERMDPPARVLRLPTNRGYSAAINAAAAAVPPTEALFVLNPDIRLGPGSVARLLRALDEPGVGIVVPRLLEADGRVAPSLRRDPSVGRALAAAVLGGKRAGRINRLGEVIYDPATYERAGEAAWASGAAMLISRPCLDAVGAWDESFFLYSEETEYALRARDHGFGLRYIPEAWAVHLGGESHVDPNLWTLSTVNRVRLFGRRHGAVATAAFRGALVLNEAVRSLSGNPAHRAALKALLSPLHPTAAPG